MNINTDSIISVTSANKNFSKATRIAEKYGQATILKGNRPKYVLIDLDQNPQFEMSQNEKIEYLGKKILNKYIVAFKELAK